ncbi:hypothetical protein QJS10_CPB18g00197 [Acorus calamus]|uniref:Uncharacterized protein n=1 Tax=Acorus calamus TaxID=4465 RepID=A0AAV9CQI8_ACOCL|nr:hypothetical protein QJS10_CPB18g00197 [Acorus calamus]
MDFPGDEGSWSSRNQRTRVSEARRGHHQSRYVVLHLDERSTTTSMDVEYRFDGTDDEVESNNYFYRPL